jgi:hypothetical protein
VGQVRQDHPRVHHSSHTRPHGAHTILNIPCMHSVTFLNTASHRDINVMWPSFDTNRCVCVVCGVVSCRWSCRASCILTGACAGMV